MNFIQLLGTKWKSEVMLKNFILLFNLKIKDRMFDFFFFQQPFCFYHWQRLRFVFWPYVVSDSTHFTSKDVFRRLENGDTEFEILSSALMLT